METSFNPFFVNIHFRTLPTFFLDNMVEAQYEVIKWVVIQIWSCAFSQNMTNRPTFRIFDFHMTLIAATQPIITFLVFFYCLLIIFVGLVKVFWFVNVAAFTRWWIGLPKRFLLITNRAYFLFHEANLMYNVW